MNGLGVCLARTRARVCTSCLCGGSREQCNRMLPTMRASLSSWKMRLTSLGLALLLALSAMGGSASGAEGGRGHAQPLAEEGGTKKRLSDAQIKKLLIEESIAAYEG